MISYSELNRQFVAVTRGWNNLENSGAPSEATPVIVADVADSEIEPSQIESREHARQLYGDMYVALESRYMHFSGIGRKVNAMCNVLAELTGVRRLPYSTLAHATLGISPLEIDPGDLHEKHQAVARLLHRVDPYLRFSDTDRENYLWKFPVHEPGGVSYDSISALDWEDLRARSLGIRTEDYRIGIQYATSNEPWRSRAFTDENGAIVTEFNTSRIDDSTRLEEFYQVAYALGGMAQFIALRKKALAEGTHLHEAAGIMTSFDPSAVAREQFAQTVAQLYLKNDYSKGLYGLEFIAGYKTLEAMVRHQATLLVNAGVSPENAVDVYSHYAPYTSQEELVAQAHAANRDNGLAPSLQAATLWQATDQGLTIRGLSAPSQKHALELMVNDTAY